MSRRRVSCVCIRIPALPLLERRHTRLREDRPCPHCPGTSNLTLHGSLIGSIPTSSTQFACQLVERIDGLAVLGSILTLNGFHPSRMALIATGNLLLLAELPAINAGGVLGCADLQLTLMMPMLDRYPREVEEMEH
jgi:hypothetical protein